MPYNWYKVIGEMDPEEGGAPIAEIDVEDRTLKVGTKRKIKALAAAYSFVAEDSGTVFLTTAALTLTLPAPSAALAGCHGRVILGGGAFTLATTADLMVAFNDATATSLTFSQAAELIGSAIDFVCDGTKWWTTVMLAAEAVTSIVA